MAPPGHYGPHPLTPFYSSLLLRLRADRAYSFYVPRETEVGVDLWHRGKGVQSVPKEVYHSDRHHKDGCRRQGIAIPESITPQLGKLSQDRGDRGEVSVYAINTLINRICGGAELNIRSSVCGRGAL